MSLLPALLLAVAVGVAAAGARRDVLQRIDPREPAPPPRPSLSAERALALATGAAAAAARLLPATEAVRAPACRAHARAYLRALADAQPWALQMLDATGTLPPGLLAGSSASLGDFDECLNVATSLPTGDIEGDIGGGDGALRGRYCLARIVIPPRTSRALHPSNKDLNNGIARNDILMGMCVPSGCSAQDLQEFLSGLQVREENMTATFTSVEVEERMCQMRESFTLDSTDAAAVAFFAFILLVLGISSAYDIVTSNEKYMSTFCGEKRVKRLEFLLCFSIPRSVKKLITYKPSEDGLDSIFGIKFLTMMVIILSHSMAFTLGGPVQNADFTQWLLEQPHMAFLNNNILYVETFLFIGAFLLAYHLLKEFAKETPVNPVQGILFRYIRLTPAYLVVVLLYMSLLPAMDSGPLWVARVRVERDRCRRAWWANLLYVNNYVLTDSICMFQSWYLAADTQLFAVALALMVALRRRPALRQGVLAALVAVSIAVGFGDTLVRRIDPTIVLKPREVEDISTDVSFRKVYIKSHLRATSYFCGLLLGHWLHAFRDSGKKLSWRLVLGGWAVAAVAGLSSIFSVLIFYWPGRPHSAIEAALYAGFVRVGWCVTVGWVIFACATGNAGYLSRLLSWKVLVPLGRLSYCAYLTNGIVELRNAGTLRVPVHVDAYNLSKIYVSDFFMTYLAGLALSLFIDSPMQAIQSTLISRGCGPWSMGMIFPYVSPATSAGIIRSSGDHEATSSNNMPPLKMTAEVAGRRKSEEGRTQTKT